MSIAGTPKSASPQATFDSWKNWMSPSLIAIGFLPLIYCHLVGLLSRPHYQFIVLLPLAIWMVSTPTIDEAIVKNKVSKFDEGFAFAGLILSAIGLGYATWTRSPWIAAVSAMIASLVVLLHITGRQGLGRFMPIWLLCGILIPLPFGLDEDLIVRLRSVTTRFTSILLDQLGILHQAYANVIELPGKPLFIADACSGIHSLYVLLAASLFLAVYCRRSVLHALFLLGTTFGLVLVENVARITTVAFAWGRGFDLSIGWKHSAIGVLLFVFSIGLILTTDQLLLFLLPKEPFRWLKRIFTKSSKSASSGGSTQKGAKHSSLPVGFLALSAVFPLLGFTQLLRLPDAISRLDSIFQSNLKVPELGRDAMPEQLEGFRLTQFESIDRVEGDPFGMSSQRWTYEKEGLSVGISLDYPYDGVKDMTQCYEAVGWKIKTSVMADAATLQSLYQIDTPEADVAVVDLQRELLGQSLLIFSSFDLNGKSSALLKKLAAGTVDDRIAGRLDVMKNGELPAEASAQPNPPYLQIHLLARTASPLTIESKTEVLKLYTKARKQLIPLVLDAVNNSANNKKSGGN
jgi:exosortase